MVDPPEIPRKVCSQPRTILTPAVLATLSENGHIKEPDLGKRVSILLENLKIALTQRKEPWEKVICFSMYLGDRGSRAKKLTLKAEIGNRATGPQVITVILPAEGDGLNRHSRI